MGLYTRPRQRALALLTASALIWSLVLPTAALAEEPTADSPPIVEPAPEATPEATPAPTPEPTPEATPELATEPYLVTFAAGVTAAVQAEVLAGVDAVETDAIPQLRIRTVLLRPTTAVDVVAALGQDARVLRVETDRVRSIEGTPDDPSYIDQWSLPVIGWEQAFGVTSPTGSAEVAILDTGVDTSHPDLDDVVVPGAAFVDGATWSSDPNGHGTALAGIVAAETGNEIGVAGVGYAGVRIMPVTVLGADGIGQDSDIIEGVVWAADNGADVILMAFSAIGYSASLQAAVDYAWSSGAVLVAASGNDGSSVPAFPAGHRGVMGVSSTDASDALAAGSNYGEAVFLGAPGVGIVTTSADGGYGPITGTSAAAAHVAGAAALLAAADPPASNGVIVGRLARNADPAGTADQTGNGRLNLARALADESTDAVTPAGAPPVGGGGPFVGPYVAAARNLILTFSGTGTGSVVITPSIGTVNAPTSCGGTGTAAATQTVTSTCAPNITMSENDATVTFTANPSGSSTFAGWSESNSLSASNCTGTANPCSAVLGGSPRLKVTFNARGNQTITFGALAGKTYGDVPFAVSATATSGLAVSFSSLTTGVCTVAGSTVTIVAAGGCSIAANQAGNATWNAAPQVTQGFTVTQATLTVTAADKTKEYGAPNPALTFAYSGWKGTDGPSDLTTAPTCSTTATLYSGVTGSPYPITCSGGLDDNYAFSYVAGGLTVTQATLTVTADPQTRQYSDPSPATLTFQASGWKGTDGPSVLTTAPTCSTTATLYSGVTGSPYPITCSGGLDDNYAFAYISGTFTVTREDADATYTGDMLAFTAPGGLTASVVLRATIRDSSLYTNDLDPGDIRNARVTFKDGVNSLLGCSNLPVTLINGDTRIGTASCTAVLGLDDHLITIQVNDHYVGSGYAVVEVAQPDGSFITGGGHIVISSSAGRFPAATGTRMNFGFNVKYNRRMTNLQGHLNAIFRANGRTYQIKSTAISSLGIALRSSTGAPCSGPPSATCWGLADFRSKANLTDVTDPLAPISLGGSHTLRVTMTDKGEPGAFDSIGFTLWDGSTLLFSSNWSGAMTTEKVLTGGNLVVH
ncbi:MAG TPA: S8 family serine peptidase [Patescibacteria group bacterium]|nr:S8 family serine peptidase [Patescibacteria group bacterium]